jgi:hypothetical protein
MRCSMVPKLDGEEELQLVVWGVKRSEQKERWVEYQQLRRRRRIRSDAEQSAQGQ